MLRIDFNSEELNRLCVAEGPDPLWETALSLHLLQHGQASAVFGPWRREVRAALARAGLTGAVRSLIQLCPHARYFPDFLTPVPGGEGGTGGIGGGSGGGSGSGGRQDFETGLDLVLSTPRTRLAADLTRLYAGTPGRLPRGARLLAEGDTEALHWLGEALRRYYEVAVRPYLPAIRAEAAVDRTERAEASLRGGPEELLASYGELLAWNPGDRRLLMPYPLTRELRLEGRSLRLVPSFFCVRTPVALADQELPPVLVYPLAPPPGWLPGDNGANGPEELKAPTERSGPYGVRGPLGPSGPHPAAPAMVAQLIGTSRALVLEALNRPMTTTQLAASLRLAPSTASRHASVLREAGLVASRRRGGSVVHTRTALGEALLGGSPRAGTAARTG